MSGMKIAGAELDLVKLKGQSNYIQWVRDFRILAEYKGVWELFFEDGVALAKPDRIDYAIKHSVPPAHGEKRFSEPEKYSRRIAMYELDLEEYDRNLEKRRLARALLFFSVDPTIRGRLVSLSTPKAAWDYLEENYLMDEMNRRLFAKTRFERATLPQYGNVQDFLCALEQFKFDLEEEGVPVPDAKHISKILNNLPLKFQTVVDQHDSLCRTVGPQANTVHDLTSRLLIFEMRNA